MPLTRLSKRPALARTTSASGQATPSRLPRHLGIIMDGNGRWAQARGLPRSAGHQQALTTVKQVVARVSALGIPCLSLYTFSTENWKRARDEVDFLMSLITAYLRNEYRFYRKNRIRVVHSGDLAQLPPAVVRELNQVMADTCRFDGLTVNLAINYGGRDEILRGVRGFIEDLLDDGASLADVRQALDELDEDGFGSWLDAPDLPPVDLIIRTGGEKRISNFMLWKAAYAELSFSDRLWPDWAESDLLGALEEYGRRERRFGGVPARPVLARAD